MRAQALVLALLAAGQAARAQERLGFHVRGWVQWEAQHIGLGQGDVGGPYGVGFTVHARLEGASFTIKVRPSVAADSVTYGATVETRIAVSDSQAPVPLYAIDRYHRSVAVRRGESARLILPFHPEPGEAAELNILIQGPFEARPPDSAGWMQRIIAEPRGVYYRNIPYQAALAVSPEVCPGAVAVRLSRSAEAPGVVVLACGSDASPIRIPGIEGSWLVMMPQMPPPRRAERCFLVNEPPPAGIRNFQPRSWANWCVRDGDAWAPVPVRLSTGQALRAQLIP